ncbi:SGNH/GDSL hydrolase family protein [Cyclobacterium marinum]|uniref:SGNH/GDSL hydrolase family protein n=1 Tax=Cyclobacterium marinum TaxID=104 RepID=UPI0011EC05DA|nr:SGNH/GDSL hydrolase family protein [Cyclobacterium marinum]MBI0400871.1 SGNH/GDSL hydrolase family protein [Cyclobacterium marinum]
MRSLLLGLILVIVSCETSEKPLPSQRILVIGNSITIHPPDSSIGWNANWGMAASGPDQDYFSLLKADLQKHTAELDMIRENVYPFERGFETIDYDQYEHLKVFQADIIIIRLGENIQDEEIANWNLAEAIEEFAFYFGREDTKYIVTTTFWPRPLVNEQLIHVANKNLWKVVDISDLGSDPDNMAIGKFENQAVASHPNDQGMKGISAALARAVRDLE